MRISIITLVLLVAFAGCPDDGTVGPEAPAANVFQVHLQNGFSHTPVSVTVDHRPVFADTVSTSFILALAAVFPVQITQGTHTLSVAIPDTA
ncbi:MAG TPA: hypothetical protein VMG09_18175 [Bacteroidota bacterium]|nr:hypothetical protein [Bacteroidota bacterium]